MVTRKEVADKAGVSVAAVSYVLNNKSGVSADTRQKVLKVIKELGYSPNYIARTLKTKKTNQLAIFINYLGDPFEAGILLHLENLAKNMGYHVFFHTFQSESQEEELRAFLQGRVDGVILMGQSLSPPMLDYLKTSGIAIVSIAQPVKLHSEVPYIDIEWKQSMGKLINHFQEYGHSKIGFMSVRDEYHHSEIRKQAFIHAMNEAGLACDPQRFLSTGVKLEWANEEMGKFLDGGNPEGYTAFVAASDLMAIGMLSACNERRIAVPEEMAIASCENILMTEHTNPKVTVLNYPRPEVAAIALNMLLQEIAGQPAVSSYIACELLIRESTI